MGFILIKATNQMRIKRLGWISKNLAKRINHKSIMRSEKEFFNNLNVSWEGE